MDKQEYLERKMDEIEWLKSNIQNIYLTRDMPEDVKREIHSIFMEYSEILQETINRINNMANERILTMGNYEEDIEIQEKEVIRLGSETYMQRCQEEMVYMKSIVEQIEEQSVEEDEEEVSEKKQTRFNQKTEQETQELGKVNGNAAEALVNEINDRISSCEQIALRNMYGIFGNIVEQYREDVNRLRIDVKLGTLEKIYESLAQADREIQSQLEDAYQQYIDNDKK